MSTREIPVLFTLILVDSSRRTQRVSAPFADGNPSEYAVPELPAVLKPLCPLPEVLLRALKYILRDKRLVRVLRYDPVFLRDTYFLF